VRSSIEVSQRATLVRLPEPQLRALRRLVHLTRVSQSSYLREAIGDLLTKYEHLLTGVASANLE